jgi:TonB family protein
MMYVSVQKLALILLPVLAVSAAMCAQEPSPAIPPPDPSASTPPASTPPSEMKPLHIGGSVKPPRLLHSVDPVFSEKARQAKQGGVVQVYLWVTKEGLPSHVRVVKGVGMGLDEKAVEAIRQYRFAPATLNGEPVVCDLYIEVNFQIFRK